MSSITDESIRDFLSTGTRTGTIGYTAGDGRPLAVPVWFMLEGDELVFNTSRDSAKAKALARDPRVVVCVDVPEPPYGFVQIQGEARVSEDRAELRRTATEIGGRYMGQDRAEEFGNRNSGPGEIVVRVRPIKVVAALDLTS